MNPMLPTNALPENPLKNYWSIDDFLSWSTLPAFATLHKNYEIGMHTHEYVEINVVVCGAAQHYLGDDVFATSQGDVFAIPPHVQHGYQHGHDFDVFHLHIAPSFFDAHGYRLRLLPGFLTFFTVEPFFRAETNFRHALRLDTPRMTQVTALLQLLDSERKEVQPGSETASEGLTLFLVTQLCRWVQEAHHNETVQHPQTCAMQNVFDIVAARYAEKLTLEDLASAAHMQRNYFCRLFHDITGQTPMAFVNHYRIQLAQRLLEDSEHSITDIAQDLGFYDSSHFARLFSKLTGRTPSQVRRKQLQS